MTIGTDLCSVATHGWFTEPILVDNLTPVGTYGWYYADAGLILVSASYQVPIELLATSQFVSNIPIELLGEDQEWILNARGVLWCVDDCGIVWFRDEDGTIWNLRERN